MTPVLLKEATELLDCCGEASPGLEMQDD